MENIDAWVNRAKNNEDQKLRQAIHLILLAISRDKSLSQTLALKGGLMLAIVYSSDRYTSDIDLSLLENAQKMSKESLQDTLEKQLKAVVAISNYDLELMVQSIQDRPKRNPTKATFPAYKLKIGYADIKKPNAVKQLKNKQSANIIEIDVSFNESVSVYDIECFKLEGKYNVLCYTLEQLVAEKYRSVLQQEVRNRNRRQDIYDLYYLLDCEIDSLSTDETKKTVLNKLLKSASGRGIDDYLHSKAMQDEAIKTRSLEDFNTLLQEIDIKPDASSHEMYDKVKKYFESLPWNDS
ncbi:TPA: nucleotidyl transferase AbiEii/AbiGii toxin family protein [Salmonella enterica]|uniref:Nucleotidyl transferase AbiEii/AbiGii toxin family protein n=1 Tax=Salmonella enterica TaxID=28901 RepID=A0A758JSX4_SALER|nr:nucleotidyl transferase AbiEii/AbiGii toxin family protein [Klebsiella oxytoca]HAG1192601.1 nucleotidyl transferase AbiEii/AbiGii toxin family protein [Salmonella enterica]